MHFDADGKIFMFHFYVYTFLWSVFPCIYFRFTLASILSILAFLFSHTQLALEKIFAKWKSDEEKETNGIQFKKLLLTERIK